MINISSINIAAHPQFAIRELNREDSFEPAFPHIAKRIATLAAQVEEELRKPYPNDAALLENLKEVCVLIDSIPLRWLNPALTEINTRLAPRQTRIIRSDNEVWLARRDLLNGCMQYISGLKRFTT